MSSLSLGLPQRSEDSLPLLVFSLVKHSHCRDLAVDGKQLYTLRVIQGPHSLRPQATGLSLYHSFPPVPIP